MRVVHPRFTRADYNRLPEGFPAQLVHGHLVRQPAPTYGHQVFQSRLLAQLTALVGADRALPAPCDVGIDEFNVYQPDVLVLRDIPPRDDVHDVGIPLLAIEVLSPSTARRDREVKRRKLIEAGVAEVWIVDPATKSVELHTAAGRRVVEGDEALRSTVVEGFEVVPSRLFAPPKR
jgi:Uma2 family endonuclease